MNFENFSIEEELNHLEQVLKINAAPAVIFYCTRILEVISSDVEKQVLGKTSGQLYSSLIHLSETGLISHSSSTYCHSLRRLGNDARHVFRRLDENDAQVAMSLLYQALKWYDSGSNLWCPKAGSKAAKNRLPLDPETVKVMELIDNYRPGVDLVQISENGSFFQTPIYASLLAENLIAQGKPDQIKSALEILNKSLEFFSNDLRLRQLLAWGTRLSGDYDGCLIILEQLFEEKPSDPETLCFLGGTYKRLWDNEGNKTNKVGKKKLIKATDFYTKAWKISGSKDCYAGVNAATLNALSGNHEKSQEIATKIINLYEKRRGVMAPGEMISFNDYWDRVTLAEANVIAGNVTAAQHQYKEAFTIYSKWKTYCGSSKAQLSILLQALDSKMTTEDFIIGTKSKNSSQHITKEDTQMYKPEPIDTSTISIPEHLMELTETLAANVHENWAAKRKSEGWRYGLARDDQKLTHPDIVPFNKLPEEEKEYDRISSEETIKVLLKLGYKIEKM